MENTSFNENVKTIVRMLGESESIECGKPHGIRLFNSVKRVLQEAVERGWDFDELWNKLETMAERRGYKLCNCNNSSDFNWLEYEIAFERFHEDYEYRFVFRVWLNHEGRIVDYKLYPIIQIVANDEKALKRVLSWARTCKT
jgi:hypothetical protein